MAAAADLALNAEVFTRSIVKGIDGPESCAVSFWPLFQRAVDFSTGLPVNFESRGVEGMCGLNDVVAAEQHDPLEGLASKTCSR
jgi:hypothetical protein